MTYSGNGKWEEGIGGMGVQRETTTCRIGHEFRRHQVPPPRRLGIVPAQSPII